MPGVPPGRLLVTERHPVPRRRGAHEPRASGVPGGRGVHARRRPRRGLAACSHESRRPGGAFESCNVDWRGRAAGLDARAVAGVVARVQAVRVKRGSRPAIHPPRRCAWCRRRCARRHLRPGPVSAAGRCRWPGVLHARGLPSRRCAGCSRCCKADRPDWVVPTRGSLVMGPQGVLLLNPSSRSGEGTAHDLCGLATAHFFGHPRHCATVMPAGVPAVGGKAARFFDDGRALPMAPRLRTRHPSSRSRSVHPGQRFGQWPTAGGLVVAWRCAGLAHLFGHVVYSPVLGRVPEWLKGQTVNLLAYAPTLVRISLHHHEMCQIRSPGAKSQAARPSMAVPGRSGMKFNASGPDVDGWRCQPPMVERPATFANGFSTRLGPGSTDPQRNPCGSVVSTPLGKGRGRGSIPQWAPRSGFGFRRRSPVAELSTFSISFGVAKKWQRQI